MFIGSSFAQQPRTGSFVANDPAVYPVSGDVTVIDDFGPIIVIFESNFSTVQGLTLEVFLTKTPTLNLATDIKISTTPLDAGTPTNTPITGMRMFNVPPGVKLHDFENVIIQCTSINELWGHANLCSSNVVLSFAPVSDGFYRAEQTLECTTVIDSGATITFEAADYIVLDAGFTAPLTTEFTALAGSGYGCAPQ